MAVAGVLAPLAACSGGAAPAPPIPSPTPIASPTPILAPVPTATPSAGLRLNEPESFDGYMLFSPGRTGYAYLVDNQGRLAHRRPSGGNLARLLDNGNILTPRNQEIDPEGNVVWDYRFPQHHEILKLPNGNVLLLSSQNVSLEEAAALGANPDSLPCSDSPLMSTMRGTRIIEARPTGPTSAETVWRWSVFDHLVQDFDPDKPNYGVVADHPERIDINYALADAPCKQEANRSFIDWTHANALDYNAELDQIMITVRHFSEVWIIDRSATIAEAARSAGGAAGKGGDLLYRWGNPRAHGAGTPADQRLFWPHAAHWIPEGSPGAGNVLILNNGNEYPGFERGYSSVDEIALPSDGYAYRLDAGLAYGPNEAVWTHIADPPESFSALFSSNAQRMPNGNTLITDAPAGRIFEVTSDGEMVWDFVNPVPDEIRTVYRAFKYSPDHPGLRGLDLTPWRTAYRAAVQGEPAARSTFDLYLMDGALVYVKEPCQESDVANRFVLHIVPERLDDLLATRLQYGFNKLDFDFSWPGELFDGKCAARFPLPDYPAAAIRTGQHAPDGSPLWTAQLRLNPEPERAAYLAAVAGEPTARSTFDVYARDGVLVYAKEQCGRIDVEHRFFLHVVPEQADDLPEAWSEHGYDNVAMDFDLNLDLLFDLESALPDDACAGSVPLPDYPISRIRTGQRAADESFLWNAQFWLNPEPHRAAYFAAAGSEPAARAAFDVYVRDGALVYVKEQCGQADIQPRFFLHIAPERVDDLPEARREAGFDNKDFDFFWSGALFDGKCAARVPLPDYAVASIRTGQFIRGEGELWSAEFAIGNGSSTP